jgi:hypothetical protein
MLGVRRSTLIIEFHDISIIVSFVHSLSIETTPILFIVLISL